MYTYLLRDIEIAKVNHVWCYRYNVHSHGEGLLLLGGGHGLGKQDGSSLAVFQHLGQFILCKCPGRGSGVMSHLQCRMI